MLTISKSKTLMPLFLLTLSSAALADSTPSVDYPGTTARLGMHACPTGNFMIGFHQGADKLLCQVIDDNWPVSYGEKVERDNQEDGMLTCQRGYAMTGIHAGDNKLLCYPFNGSGFRFTDGSTQRVGMHGCPEDSVMVGVNLGANKFRCENK